MDKGTELWVCGIFLSEGEHGTSWELKGVFSTEELATKSCMDEYHFIGPVKLDEPFSNKKEVWAGCYYPIGEVIIEVKNTRNEGHRN